MRSGWGGADDRRLRALILAMLPYAKILTAFPDHSANAIREAYARLSGDEMLPVELAMAILGEEAEDTRSAATSLRLDGRQASPHDLVAAANVALRAKGLPPIAYGVERTKPSFNIFTSEGGK